MSLKRVVITGIGALTPIGNTLEEYWAGLLAGKSGAAPITYFDASQFKTKFACEVKNFDVEDFMDRRQARRMDRYAQYAMVATAEAMAQSGMNIESIDQDRAGVIWGSGIGGLRSLEVEIESYAKGSGVPRFSPFMIPKMISDIAAGYLSIEYGFRGHNFATVSACASSTHAIALASQAIRRDEMDVMITGGSEAAVTVSGIGGFNAMKALSQRNDDPETASRPFDLDRDGFVLGEGAGSLILESYEHATKRGAVILGEIAGVGMTADAHHITAPHPEGAGARAVMNMALKDAQLEPTDIGYINVHGTSTPLGDLAEVKAIKHVFGDHAYDINISSTKSMTGHLLGAAGAIEAIACLQTIRTGKVAPTINHFTDDPDLDARLNFTFNEAQEKKVDAALSNTFGFGGHNSSVIIKRFE